MEDRRRFPQTDGGSGDRSHLVLETRRPFQNGGILACHLGPQLHHTQAGHHSSPVDVAGRDVPMLSDFLFDFWSLSHFAFVSQQSPAL